jgi:hypothetical protein
MGQQSYKSSDEKEWETVPGYFDSDEYKRRREVEGAMVLRWRRLVHAYEGIGDLMPDKVNSRAPKTALLAAELLLAEIEQMWETAEEYMECAREKANGC